MTMRSSDVLVATVKLLDLLTILFLRQATQRSLCLDLLRDARLENLHGRRSRVEHANINVKQTALMVTGEWS